MTELIKIFEPLTKVTSGSPNGVTALAREIGYRIEGQDATNATAIFEDVTTAIDSLDGLVHDPFQPTVLMQNLRLVMDTLHRMETISAGLGQAVLDYLLIIYLENHRRRLFGLLAFLGIIEKTDSGTNPSYTVRKVRWDRFSKILSLKELFHTVYGWGSSAFDPIKMLIGIQELARSFGIPAFPTDNDPIQQGISHELSANWQVLCLQTPGAYLINESR